MSVSASDFSVADDLSEDLPAPRSASRIEDGLGGRGSVDSVSNTELFTVLVTWIRFLGRKRCELEDEPATRRHRCWFRSHKHLLGYRSSAVRGVSRLKLEKLLGLLWCAQWLLLDPR
jgi:hypothetical protein